MSRYWIYLNNEVAGPFEVDQLIRKRGFAREARVCLEQPDGGTGEWMSASEIPELSRIFRAADEMNRPDPSPPPVKTPPKPHPVVSSRPAPITRPEIKKEFSPVWILLGAVAVGAMAFLWMMQSKAEATREMKTVRSMVENTRFPSDSPYRTVRHYLDEKKIDPRWDIEPVGNGVSKVTLSWFDETVVARSQVYAFEANPKALSVRALNSAAVRWLSEGPVPKSRKVIAPPPAPKKPSSEDLFKGAIDTRRSAIENADYAAVWNLFSQRKQSEMIQAGMSESGYVQLQSLRNKVDSAPTQKMLKSTRVSATEKLVLIRESHPQHGDVFLKQRWLFEDGDWRLDNEEKRAAEVPATPAPSEPAEPEPAKPTMPIQSLPGLSN